MTRLREATTPASTTRTPRRDRAAVGDLTGLPIRFSPPSVLGDSTPIVRRLTAVPTSFVPDDFGFAQGADLFLAQNPTATSRQQGAGEQRTHTPSDSPPAARPNATGGRCWVSYRERARSGESPGHLCPVDVGAAWAAATTGDGGRASPAAEFWPVTNAVR